MNSKHNGLYSNEEGLGLHRDLSSSIIQHGLYVDIETNVALFSSLDKLYHDSEFYHFKNVLNKNLVVVDDEINDGRSNIRLHKTSEVLGYVCNDQSLQAGFLYCIKRSALKFVPLNKIIEEGFINYFHLFESLPRNFDQIILGGGCFWGVEAYFKKVSGIIDTCVGYSGGTKANPTYKEVCKGDTGHAEVVLVTFDPYIITLDRILRHFFKIHDPTQIDRQGMDIGPQYRSVIFYVYDKQLETIEKILNEQLCSGIKVATQIEKALNFYKAEEYHQDYLDKNPHGYCHVNLNKIWDF